MPPKPRTVITFEGWSYLAVMAFLLAGALLREINLLLVLFGLMAGPLVISRYVVWRAIQSVSFRRRVPPSVTAGDLLVVEVEASNDGRYGAWAMVVEDRLKCLSSATVPVTATGCAFRCIPAGERRISTYRGRLHQRGRYKLGPLRISTRFPLGLLRRTRILEDSCRLVVYPRLGRLNPGWTQIYHASMHGSSTVSPQRSPAEGDFHSLRDWRLGDPRRSIHWRTSARHERLVVRQYEQPRMQDLVLVVDLWQPDEATPDELERVERAVRMAATAASDACRRGGSRLLLCIVGRETTLVQGKASPGVLSEALEALAVATAGPHDAFQAALQTAAGVARSATAAVVISTRRLDLTDRERYPALWKDNRLATLVSRSRTIDVGSDRLAEFYQDEEPLADAQDLASNGDGRAGSNAALAAARGGEP